MKKPLSIVPINLLNHLKYKNMVVLTYKIVYPYFEQKKSTTIDVLSINQYYVKKVANFLAYVQTKLYQSAILNYDESIANNFPFHPYEAIMEYTSTMNGFSLISLYSDQYEFAGGAHGSTLRTSDTWSIKNSIQLPLNIFFPNNPFFEKEIKETIIHQIEEQIKQGTGSYFNDYVKLVEEYFNPKSYYLTSDAIIFYFQQYEIAPYASGIPQFSISYQ